MKFFCITKQGHVSEHGFTLIELMIALAIGSFLVIGAAQVYMQGRSSLRVNESVSRLHEDARYALEILEPDIRMASYYGLQSRPGNVINGVTAVGGAVVAGLGVTGDCANNWSIFLAEPIGGTNNAYTWPSCAAVGGAQAGSDTLIIRRVSEDAIPVLDANTLYLQSARVVGSQLFRGAAIPAGPLNAANSQTHELVVSGYYVSAGSTLGANIPSLRRWFLDNGPGGPFLNEEELLPGVEDMQIEFGLDTDAIGTVNRGSVNQYVNPGAPIITVGDPLFNPSAQILSVRVWLLIRSQLTENGYTDVNNYAYSDRNWAGAPAPANVRRVLVSKTVFLRNARTTI